MADKSWIQCIVLEGAKGTGMMSTISPCGVVTGSPIHKGTRRRLDARTQEQELEKEHECQRSLSFEAVGDPKR